MRAEDALPDYLNAAMDGMIIRKGTIAAFLANAKVIADEGADAAAERDIVDALPSLRAVGLFGVMEVRDTRVRALVEAHATTGDTA